ncbi:unnamed protein product, partial [marine sediment metagenome]
MNMATDANSSELWNMAMAYHKRIDELLTTCAVSQMSGKGLQWYKALFRLYIEVQAKMKDDEKERAREMLDKLTAEKNKV